MSGIHGADAGDLRGTGGGGGTAGGGDLTSFWAETALIGGSVQERVRITGTIGSRALAGTITAIETGVEPHAGEQKLDTVLPGFANAHSHAFHRALRGRTHDDGGDFWQWRTEMYRVAGRLDPESYRALATAVFAEMVTSGFTAVGEFHYVHHRPDGSPYTAHAMEQALAEAAADSGIRLTLLDACYLTGGIGLPLSAAQRRFGDGGGGDDAGGGDADGDAGRWLERWHALRDALPPTALLGAALHSVRAVPREAIRRIARELPSGVPLHVHLSEQPQENTDCLEAYGLTPTGLLAEAGLLERLSVVHATHLTDDDIRMLGEAGSTVVMCPSTEADLGDGIGPARALADAGARIALGSDQNAVIDPLLECRGLEAGARLASGRRGRFTPAELAIAASSDGYRSLGLTPRGAGRRLADATATDAEGLGAGRPGGPGERGPAARDRSSDAATDAGGLRLGAPFDLVELDSASTRTAGSRPAQLLLTATAADVRTVVVGGTVRARSGVLADGRHPAALLAAALEGLS